MANRKISPVRKQYLDIKKKHPNEIVFFRLGDFYETFDKDAEITSKELDLVLTSRNVSKNNRVPMAGIPFHAAENYIGRLLKKGYHVAICEQVGDQPQNGLFDRKVVRILSPGTILDPTILAESKSNYLAAIFPDEGMYGFAYVDLSTGEFRGTSFVSDEPSNVVYSEISRIRPSEILVPESLKIPFENEYFTTKLPDWWFEVGRCTQNLKALFQVETLEGFGLEKNSVIVVAAGVISEYVQHHDHSTIDLLKNFQVYHLDDFMILDESTRRNLELTESLAKAPKEATLINVMDQTRSPMGKRLIRNWINEPLINKTSIEHRQDCVTFFFENGLARMEVQDILRKLTDIERIVNRIRVQHGSPRDVVSLKNSLALVPQLMDLTISAKEKLKKVNGLLSDCHKTIKFIQRAIADDPPATTKGIGIIRKGYSKKLDSILESTKNSRDWIANLEVNEKKRTGIKSLRVGYNKIYGYYIEISKGQADQAPESYIRKQTLVNSERFVTAELKEYETIVLNAEERIHELELKLFSEICEIISADSEQILKVAKSIAVIDVLSSFAQVAADNNYCKPDLVLGKEMSIKDGRHPVVEKTIEQYSFVANDTNLSENTFIHIITGPNMSGKSTYLRQVAQIVLMAQIGSFVPADAARIGLVDRIFTRIGAQDEIHSGLSTFMVEMVETANILNNATEYSLLILDEIGRGTSTYDGLSIAWAVLEFIHNHPKLKSRTLFATHYHELTHLPDTLPHMKNYNVAVSENKQEIVFLHKIIEGKTDRSYGIHVAQMAGIPKSVTERANDLLNNLEIEKAETSGSNNFVKPKQMEFFQTHPVIEEIESIDLDAISPIEAINMIYTWRKRINKPE